MPRPKPSPVAAGTPTCCGRPCRKVGQVRSCNLYEIGGEQVMVDIDRAYYCCGVCRRTHHVGGIKE